MAGFGAPITGRFCAPLTVEFRIVPIGLDNGGLEVVDDEGFGRAAEVTESILDAADELFGGLPRHHFAVGFAGAAAGPCETGADVFVCHRAHDGRALAEVHLGFLTWPTFHPPERQRRAAIQSTDKPLNGLIIRNEAMFIS